MEQNKRTKFDQNREISSDKHGRIGRLDENTLSYYRRVNQTLIEGFSEESDEKELFLKNVFNTLCEEALPVSQNQTASNIVELLLHEATLSQLVSFGCSLGKDWEVACTDRFASHVTQTALLQLGRLLAEKHRPEVDKETKETRDTGFGVLLEVYGFLMSNLAFHMQNTYTSHIVRVMLEILGGTTVSEKVIRSRVARRAKATKCASDNRQCQNEKFSGLVLEMCNKIAELKKIKDHMENNLSNPVLQTMILVLHVKNPDHCQEICKKLMDETDMFLMPTEDSVDEDTIRLPSLIQHEIASHFVEQLLSVVDTDMLSEIIQQLKSGLVTMAVHPVANFVLQKLIKATDDTEQFEKIFKKLSHHVEDVLGMNHPQVVVSLAEGCVKHGTKQEKLLKSMLKAFHCYEPIERQAKCVPLFASLMVYETFYKSLTKNKTDSSSDESDEDDDEKEITFPQLTSVNFHGSLLLQQLFRFGNPKLFVTSFLQMKPAEIKSMACNPCGSHVIDVFMKSNSIGEKSRDTLYQRLKGLFLELACHTHGSRTLDALFTTAPMRHKLTIAEELAKHEAKLRGEKIGRIIWAKYNIGHFSRNKAQWKQIQTGQDRKRAMFEDIIEKKVDESKQKKKRQKSIEEESNSLRLQESDESVDETSTADIHIKPGKKSRVDSPSQELRTKQKSSRKRKHNQSQNDVDQEESKSIAEDLGMSELDAASKKKMKKHKKSKKK